MKKFEPLITIVTPSYNQGQFIEETILSVLNQTYKNIQYIIVDGGSTDNTMEVVNKYRDKIDIIIHEKDKGQSDAINKGFRLALGELVGWINSDDILYENCVQNIVNLYEMRKNDGVIFYSSKVDLLDKNGIVYETRIVEIKNKNHIIHNNYDIIQQGSFYNLEIIKKINFLDEKLHYCMDLDLWLRLLNHGNIYYINTKNAVAGFRRWEEAKTTSGGNKFLLDILHVLRREGLSYFSLNSYKLFFRILKGLVKNIVII